MRTRVFIFVLAAILCVGGTAFAQNKALMANGDHDLRVKPANASGDWCKACHTPHRASASALGLLWNHTLTSTPTFSVWNTTTMPDYKGGSATVTSTTSSGLCLSCHDGTVALNSLVTGTDAGFITGTLSGNANLGTDLQNDHPVGFSYTTSLGAKPTGTLAAVTTVEATLRLFGTAKNMECGSCHDPHTNTTKFLRIANTNSALCLTCHQ
jgi:predicted CXXCH cytochrome family protein